MLKKSRKSGPYCRRRNRRGPTKTKSSGTGTTEAAFLSKDTSHVRAASRLPFKTTTPAMTPMIPYEDEIQMDVFGKVMVKRNSYESLDAVPQYNKLIHTYFKWSQMPKDQRHREANFGGVRGAKYITGAVGWNYSLDQGCPSRHIPLWYG